MPDGPLVLLSGPMTMTTAALLRARERVPRCEGAAVVDLADGEVLVATPGGPIATAALAVRDLFRAGPEEAGESTAEVIVAAGDRLLLGLRSRRRPGLGLLLVCHADTLLGLALALARVCLGEIEQEV